MFITFEGTEGSGKSTQVRLLQAALEERGYSVCVTREPGGCPIADQIRAILLDASNSAMFPLAELMLYAAARAQHVTEVIVPALKAGKVVLCDRFSDSTVAYQVHGRGLSADSMVILNDLATGGLVPALTFLLNIPVEVGLARSKARLGDDTKEARFELEELAFHHRVQKGFHELAAGPAAGRFRTINAERRIDDIRSEILSIALGQLGRGGN